MTNEHRLGVWESEGSMAFRVWAPNADSVSVVGDFNGWDWRKDAMVRDDQGCWFANVPEAKIGHQYRFELGNGPQRFTRVDP